MDLFDWDEGNWPKCGKHGVSKAEIEYVFRHRPLVRPDRTPQDEETRYNAVGINEEGRHIFIVFTLRTKSGYRLVRPISARYMHRKEVERYEQRKRT
jgi:uncharacterized DUF497 family protein